MNDHLFENIKFLPDVLVSHIYDFIPRIALVFTNKEKYNLYHIHLKKYIINYENYIRDTIRRDNHFVIGKIVEENFNIWIKICDYMYKNMIFKNYAYFVIHYCIENESTKCREVVIDFLKQLGLCKNLHKKNIVKYIRWKN